jgi:hypothetical protein
MRSRPWIKPTNTKWWSSLRHIASVFGVVSIVLGASLGVAVQQASASTDFASFSPPITGASDFATNFPSSGIGPIGLIDDGTNFFATDLANGDLYKFPASTGGSATTAQSAPDGLFGLTLANGVYYGTNLGPQVETFDPSTLATTPTSIVLPCGGLGVAGDPLSTDLYVNTTCGLYRVQNPISATPTVTLFSTSVTTDEFDGIAISSDGQQFWVADIGSTTPRVLEFDRTGALVADIPDSAGPDGIGIALNGATAGSINVSGNVFVNNNDGTIWRIDTNNSDATSTVASGGTRGDMATVGPDGCLYVTQSDRVEKMSPCFFQTTGLAFAPGGGSFVVGDGNSATGSSVTFWSPQWSKANTLSGGPASSSFQGFAENPTTPSCGAGWTTPPGNSAPAPSGPLPPEMAVIVASSASKSGSSISGNTVHIVIVKTNSGYNPSLGLAGAGTGTVVSQVC